MFVLLGVEHMRVVPGITAMNPMDLYDMPYTHSLLGTLGFAAVFAGLVYLLTRSVLGSMIAGAVVVSHWVLDVLVHRPDMTLFGTLPKFGLGLWNYPAVEMPLELALTFGALWFYVRRTRPTSSRASLALSVLTVLLLALQAIDWFGAKPQQVDASFSLLALFGYLVATLAAWWVSRTRGVAGEPARG